MIKYFQTIFLIFIVTYSFGQYIDDNQYQEKIVKCASDSIKKMNFNLTDFYDTYETSLVQNLQLQDKTGDSYMKAFYNALANEKLKKYEVVIINDIEYDTMFSHVLEAIGTCLISMKDNISLRNSESKLDKFFDNIEKFSNSESENFTTIKMVNFVTTFFKSSDFEKPLYRIYALNIFYGGGIPRDLYNEME